MQEDPKKRDSAERQRLQEKRLTRAMELRQMKNSDIQQQIEQQDQKIKELLQQQEKLQMNSKYINQNVQTDSKSTVTSTQIFGVELSELMNRKSEAGNSIPSVFKQWIKYIETKGES